MVLACDLGELLGQSFDGKSLGCVVDVVAEPIREGVVDFIYAVQHAKSSLLFSLRRVRQKEFPRMDGEDRVDQC